MASTDCNNFTPAFIDLATYDKLEKYMYGPSPGKCAATYFIRETCMRTWFTQIPVLMTLTGTPDFGQTWSAKLSSSGDYVLNSWLEFDLPYVNTDYASNQVAQREDPLLKSGIVISDASWPHPLSNVYVTNTVVTGGSGKGMLVNVQSGDSQTATFTSPGSAVNPHIADSTIFVLSAGDDRPTDRSEISRITMDGGVEPIFSVGTDPSQPVGGLEVGHVTSVTFAQTSGVGGIISFQFNGGISVAAADALVGASLTISSPGGGVDATATVVSVEPDRNTPGNIFVTSIMIQDGGSSFSDGDSINVLAGAVQVGTVDINTVSTSGGLQTGSGYQQQDLYTTSGLFPSAGDDLDIKCNVDGAGTFEPPMSIVPLGGDPTWKVGDTFRINSNVAGDPAYGIVTGIQVAGQIQGYFVSGSIQSVSPVGTDPPYFTVLATIRESTLPNRTATGLIYLSAQVNGVANPALTSNIAFETVSPPTAWTVTIVNPGEGYKLNDRITVDGGPVNIVNRQPHHINTNFPEQTIDINEGGVGGDAIINDLTFSLDKDQFFSSWYPSFTWCNNIGHNIINECSLTCNDLVVARFDNYFLDFWSKFSVPDGKGFTYYDMIDNTYGGTPGTSSARVRVPLPFFYARDSGSALPIGALPYNDVRIKFKFREWDQLLILRARNSVTDSGFSGLSGEHRYVPTLVDIQGRTVPKLSNVQVWSHYALVSNNERKMMNCAPRHMLIEQALTSPIQSFIPNIEPSPVYNLNLMHSVKLLMFGMRNTTFWNEWSNYTLASPTPSGESGWDSSSNIFDKVALLYEGTKRVEMAREYFTQVQPYYYFNPVVNSSVTSSGMHFYSYALDALDVNPTGSTNYNVIENVSIKPTASQIAMRSMTAEDTASNNPNSGRSFPQKFEFMTL
jgi:hypothetical protein